MVDVDVDGTAGRELDLYLRVATANLVAMVMKQLLKLTWPSSSERLEDMPDFDPQMAESGRGVLFLLHSVGIDRVRRVGIRRIVSGIRYALMRAFAAVLCTVSIN